MYVSPESMPPAISFLAVELIIEIFTYCIENEPLSPLTLRQVTRYWHDVVDSNPRLWRTIALDDANIYELSDTQVALWTKNAMPYKYDIELKLHHSDSIFPLISPLLPFIDRWRSLRMHGRREIRLDDDLHITPDSLGILNIVLLDVNPIDFDDSDEGDEDDEENPVVSITNVDSPISLFALQLRVFRVPSVDRLSTLRFITLTIAEGDIKRAEPKYILEFLSAFPELESFQFDGRLHNAPILTPLPVVNLPKLRILRLCNTCNVRSLLSNLNASRLNNVHLININVDFELSGEYEEDGDSEDEAHDFSQSPSSDRGTGMGLRNLINRCNPPIRVLDMDLCDLRTKDFRFVFDKLKTLEQFSITGSDMSDKVVNLFGPIPNFDNGNMGVRLPSLRCLRLENCHRLSGKALVDTLIARTRWTDSVCPRSGLVDVQIRGCIDFSLSEYDELSSVLGERLKPFS